jgi:hypothetical protein
MLRHSKLMTQHQNLDVLRRRIPPSQPQPREHPGHDQIDQLQPHDMTSSQLAAIVDTLNNMRLTGRQPNRCQRQYDRRIWQACNGHNAPELGFQHGDDNEIVTYALCKILLSGYPGSYDSTD